VWVISTRGFYSVVQGDADARLLLVRARVRADLERLAEILPGLEPWHDPAADYAWRARVERSEWAYALGVMAGEIDYRNFKDAVAERQGKPRARVYERVWSVLFSLQRR
jgi:hypothetical protein